MAPGPAIQDAAEILLPLADQVAFGLHVVLTSEWDDVRWGPVLPAEEVPSLVRPDGTFPATGDELKAQISLDEAEAEVRAQLQRLRELGFRVDYLDEHMGIGWIPGLRERFQRIAQTEGLILAERFAYARDFIPGDLESVVGAIAQVAETPKVFVFHPLTDTDPVGRRFTLGGRMPGEILRERAQERRVLTDPRLKGALVVANVQSLTYLEAASQVSE